MASGTSAGREMFERWLLLRPLRKGVDTGDTRNSSPGVRGRRLGGWGAGRGCSAKGGRTVSASPVRDMVHKKSSFCLAFAAAGRDIAAADEGIDNGNCGSGATGGGDKGAAKY